MPTPGVAVRQLAAEALAEVVGDGRSLRAVLPARLSKLADVRDRALLEAILFGACRWLPRYLALLGRLLERPLPARQRRIEALLLVGLAQLDALGLPAHAAIASSAEVARSWKQPGMVGLVNAVLRRFQREKADLLSSLDADPEARHAHPAWLITQLRRDWPQHAEAILEANNRPGPMWLRLHPAAGARSDYLDVLAAAGIAARPGAAGWEQAICLDTPQPPDSLPGWAEGRLAVQDAAAQAVSTLVALRPGMRVLDACSAPGGKAAALLEQQPALDLLALDRDPARVERMRQGLQRQGHAPRVLCADAREPAAWSDGEPFDLILLDVPCSATGVIRRQPDIKIHRSQADIAALLEIQAALLDAAWPLLAAGGQLLYTTCSVLRAENADQVEGFLARHPEARALALPERLGHPCGPGRQRLPGEQDMDGFFYAALARC